MNSNRGAVQREFDFAHEEDRPLTDELLRPELTDSASVDQPALSIFSTDALTEQGVDPANLDRAWRQVKRNRGAHHRPLLVLAHDLDTLWPDNEIEIRSRSML